MPRLHSDDIFAAMHYNRTVTVSSLRDINNIRAHIHTLLNKLEDMTFEIDKMESSEHYTTVYLSKPTRITNSWFKFHRNGIGDAPNKTRFNLTESVMDLGKSAVIEQPRARYTIQAGMQDPVYIAVRSRGYEDESANLIINGENRLGQLVYSFKGADERPITRSLTNPNETNVIQADPTYGVDFKLTNKFSLCDNIHWSKVIKITKTVTNNPVDVYAIHDSGESYLLATLAPHQRESSYRTYQLPKEECKDHRCVLAMFKLSEPDRIEFGSQSMVTSSPTALIDAMMGMDFKYFKKDLNTAATYIDLS